MTILSCNHCLHSKWYPSAFQRLPRIISPCKNTYTQLAGTTHGCVPDECTNGITRPALNTQCRKCAEQRVTNLPRIWNSEFLMVILCWLLTACVHYSQTSATQLWLLLPGGFSGRYIFLAICFSFLPSSHVTCEYNAHIFSNSYAFHIHNPATTDGTNQLTVNTLRHIYYVVMTLLVFYFAGDERRNQPNEPKWRRKRREKGSRRSRSERKKRN